MNYICSIVEPCHGLIAWQTWSINNCRSIVGLVSIQGTPRIHLTPANQSREPTPSGTRSHTALLAQLLFITTFIFLSNRYQVDWNTNIWSWTMEWAIYGYWLHRTKRTYHVIHNTYPHITANYASNLSILLFFYHSILLSILFIACSLISPRHRAS